MSEHTGRPPESRRGKGMGDWIKGEEEEEKEMQSETRRECNGVDQTREGKRMVGLRKCVCVCTAVEREWAKGETRMRLPWQQTT